MVPSGCFTATVRLDARTFSKWLLALSGAMLPLHPESPTAMAVVSLEVTSEVAAAINVGAINICGDTGRDDVIKLFFLLLQTAQLRQLCEGKQIEVAILSFSRSPISSSLPSQVRMSSPSAAAEK